MLTRIRARLTYANVIATVALFIALGGSAYAATQLPRNSVGTAQLKNGAVTGRKVAKNTLTGRNIEASTLGTVPSATHASTAGSASNATKAMSATTAGNALELGGLGSSGYFQLPGAGSDTDVPVAASATANVASLTGFGSVSATCDSPCSDPTVTYTNTSSDTELVEYQAVGTFSYEAVGPGDTIGPLSAPEEDDNIGFAYFYGVETGTTKQFELDGTDDIEPSGGTGTTFYFGDEDWS